MPFHLPNLTSTGWAGKEKPAGNDSAERTMALADAGASAYNIGNTVVASWVFLTSYRGWTLVKRADFLDRFDSVERARWYRDRFKHGRRARTDQRERTALREVLQPLGRLGAVLDLPSGTGRLSPVLAENADRTILADGAPAMLEVAREDLGTQGMDYLVTDARAISLPDQDVDLIFCHRFIQHIHHLDDRRKVLLEFARVSRKYVLISFYPPGFGSYFKWFRHLILRRPDNPKPVSLSEFIADAERAGLRLKHAHLLRRFPKPGSFYLFERTNGQAAAASPLGGASG